MVQIFLPVFDKIFYSLIYLSILEIGFDGEINDDELIMKRISKLLLVFDKILACFYFKIHFVKFCETKKSLSILEISYNFTIKMMMNC